MGIHIGMIMLISFTKKSHLHIEWPNRYEHVHITNEGVEVL